MRVQWRKVLAFGMLEHGHRLRDRIELLLAPRRESLGWTSIARVAISAAAIAIGGLMATQWIAFAQAGATFEAAPVGTNGASPRTAQYRVSRTPQRIAFQTARVGDIMAFAYGFPWIESRGGRSGCTTISITLR